MVEIIDLAHTEIGMRVRELINDYLQKNIKRKQNINKDKKELDAQQFPICQNELNKMQKKLTKKSQFTS